MTEEITISHTISLSDEGTDFQSIITEEGAVVDISTSTEQAIILKDPDGVDSVKIGELVNDGTDGLLHYTRQSSDIAQLGIWAYRGRVKFGAGKTFHAVNWVYFEVIK